MTDDLDRQIRRLVVDVMATAPDPRPAGDLVEAGRRSRLPTWVSVPAIGVTVALIIGLPALLLWGGDGADVQGGTASTVEHGTTTTLLGQPSVGDGPENPMPVGGAMSVGGWNIEVMPAGSTGAPRVFAMEDGTSLLGIKVRARKAGFGPSRGLQMDVQFSALTISGTELSLAIAGCEDPIALDQPTEQGEALIGYLCFEAPADPGDVVQLVAEALQSSSHRVYLATSTSTTGVLILGGHGFPVGEPIGAVPGTVILESVPGPPPRFDTSELGPEIPIAQNPVPVFDGIAPASPSIYIGEVGPYGAYLSESAPPTPEDIVDLVCVTMGTYQTCSDPGVWAWTPSFGGTVVMWVAVPEGTAVIALLGTEGPLAWQTPRSRIAAMWVYDPVIEAIAFDASGNTLASESISSPDGVAISSRCSGNEPPVSLNSQPDLPEPVALARQALHEAASRCDYNSLGALTGNPPWGFQYNVEAAGQRPEEYWASLETSGYRVMAMLTSLLNQPPALQETGAGQTYVWTTIGGNAPSHPRVGITAAGDWVLFVIPERLVPDPTEPTGPAATTENSRGEAQPGVAAGWELEPGDVLVASAEGVHQLRDGRWRDSPVTSATYAAMSDGLGGLIVQPVKTDPPDPQYTPEGALELWRVTPDGEARLLYRSDVERHSTDRLQLFDVVLIEELSPSPSLLMAESRCIEPSVVCLPEDHLVVLPLDGESAAIAVAAPVDSWEGGIGGAVWVGDRFLVSMGADGISWMSAWDLTGQEVAWPTNPNPQDQPIETLSVWAMTDVRPGLIAYGEQDAAEYSTGTDSPIVFYGSLDLVIYDTTSGVEQQRMTIDGAPGWDLHANHGTVAVTSFSWQTEGQTEYYLPVQLYDTLTGEVETLGVAGRATVVPSAFCCDASIGVSGLGWELLSVHTVSVSSGFPPPVAYGSATSTNAGLMEEWFGVAVDDEFFEDRILLALPLQTGAGCDGLIRLDDLVIDDVSQMVYGVFTRIPRDPDCSGMLGASFFLIAVDRNLLPPRFTLQAESELTHLQSRAVEVVLDQ